MSANLYLLFTTDLNQLSHETQKQIYDEFYRLVYRMVFFILRDHAACEDVIQDAFIRVIEKSPKTLDETKVTAWIKTVTRNATYNYLRKNKKMRDELAAGRVSDYETAAGCDTNPPVDAEVEWKLMEQALLRYIDELKPIYRHVIYMRSLENLGYNQMASCGRLKGRCGN